MPIREPDLSVNETDDGWFVELNNSTMPTVKIEKDYAKSARRNVVEKEKGNLFKKNIRSKMASKAIEKRNDTMIKVGLEIVKRQQLFLREGYSVY